MDVIVAVSAHLYFPGIVHHIGTKAVFPALYVHPEQAHRFVSTNSSSLAHVHQNTQQTRSEGPECIDPQSTSSDPEL